MKAHLVRAEVLVLQEVARELHADEEVSEPSWLSAVANVLSRFQDIYTCKAYCPVQILYFTVQILYYTVSLYKHCILQYLCL